MRSTITIEDNLFNQAAKVCNDTNISTVVTTALTEYVRAAAAKRLIALGGSAPHLKVPSRNRYHPEQSAHEENEPLKVAEDGASYNS